MYQKDAEVLFPTRVIASLQPLRGPQWQQLIDHIASLPETNPDVLAFNLVMIRLDGCLSCQADSFRAMRGCTQCTMQNIRRYRDGDQDLLKQYEKARRDLEKFHAQMRKKEE